MTDDRLDDGGRSPLAIALVKGEPEVVRTLLGHRADPDVGTPDARETAATLGQTAFPPRSEDP